MTVYTVHFDQASNSKASMQLAASETDAIISADFSFGSASVTFVDPIAADVFAAQVGGLVVVNGRGAR